MPETAKAASTARIMDLVDQINLGPGILLNQRDPECSYASPSLTLLAISVISSPPSLLPQIPGGRTTIRNNRILASGGSVRRKNGAAAEISECNKPRTA